MLHQLIKFAEALRVDLDALVPVKSQESGMQKPSKIIWITFVFLLGQTPDGGPTDEKEECGRCAA